MRVCADIDYVDLEGDYGVLEGVTATCSRCGHEMASFGTGDASVRRCFVLLHETCAREENNFYVEAEDAPRHHEEATA